MADAGGGRATDQWETTATPPGWAAESGPRLLCAAALVGAAYYLGARVGFVFHFPGSPISMLWPPNSLLLAAFLLTPTRRWWLLLAAALPAHLAVQIQHDAPLVAMLGLFVTNTGQALLGAAALRRVFPGPFALDSLRRVGLFVVCAALLAPLVIAFAASALIVGTDWGTDYRVSVQAQFLSNVLTVLTLVPPILALAASETAWFRRGALRRWAELGLLLAGTVAATWVVFSNGADPVHVAALTYLPLPFLLWAALRFGPGGVAAALLVVAAWAVMYAARGPGPFGGLSPLENVVVLQLYLITVAVPLLALAALLRERARAERRLRASEERHRTVVEAAPIGIATQDADGRLTGANPAWQAFLGYRPEELAGRDVWSVTHPADVSRNRALFAELLAGARASYALEKRYLRKDGQVVWGGLTVAAVRHEDGRLRHAIAMVADITERRRAEEALRESEARFRAMADRAPVMIWVLDAAQHPIFLNRRALDFAGLPPEEAVARWGELLHPDDAGGLRAIIAPAWAARRAFQTEYRIRRADGAYRWIVSEAVPRLGPDGTFLGYIGSALDVTERKAAEEELRRLSTRLLQLQDEEHRRLARDLHDMTAQDLFALTINLARLQHLVPGPDRAVRDLLADSRALGDRSVQELRALSYVLHPPVLDQIGLASALEWYVDGFRQRSGIDVALAIEGDVGRLPEEVETALFRVVQEGLTNVDRHSGSNSASVTLARAGDAIRLRIADQGRGIAAERGSGAGDERPSPGVGIPVMRERVRQLGGHLVIASEGRGTTLAVEVPLDGAGTH